MRSSTAFLRCHVDHPREFSRLAARSRWVRCLADAPRDELEALARDEGRGTMGYRPRAETCADPPRVDRREWEYVCWRGGCLIDSAKQGQRVDAVGVGGADSARAAGASTRAREGRRRGAPEVLPCGQREDVRRTSSRVVGYWAAS